MSNPLQLVRMLIAVGLLSIFVFLPPRAISQVDEPGMCLTWLPNAEIALSHDNRFAGKGWRENEAHLWDITTGRLIHRFVHTDTGGSRSITGVAFANQDRWVATADRYGVNVWNVDTGALQWHFQHDLDDDYTELAFFPDDRRLFVGGGLGAKIYDLQTGELLIHFPGYMEHRYGAWAQLSPDFGFILTSNWRLREAYLWDTTTFALLRTFQNIPGAQRNAAFLSEREIILNEYLEDQNSLIVHNIETGEVLYALHFGEGFTKHWRVSADFQYIWVTRDIGQQFPIPVSEIWDVTNLEQLYTSQAGLASLFDLRWRNEDALALLFWNLLTARSNESYWWIPVSFVAAVAVTDDRRYAVATEGTGEVSVWDLQQHEILHRLC